MPSVVLERVSGPAEEAWSWLCFGGGEGALEPFFLSLEDFLGVLAGDDGVLLGFIFLDAEIFLETIYPRRLGGLDVGLGGVGWGLRGL